MFIICACDLNFQFYKEKRTVPFISIYLAFSSFLACHDNLLTEAGIKAIDEIFETFVAILILILIASV